MIKKIAWNTFKNTGDINTFLELVEVENLEKNMLEAEKQNGNIRYCFEAFPGLPKDDELFRTRGIYSRCII